MRVWGEREHLQNFFPSGAKRENEKENVCAFVEGEREREREKERKREGERDCILCSVQ